MLENILKLEGAKKLTREEQKSINGKGDDLLACYCPGTGVLVVGHADNCKSLTDAFCAADS